MMRAAVIGAPGPAESLVIADGPDPRPGPDELSIDVEFAGIGFVDTLFRSGAFTLLPVPFIPGIEVTGWVRAAGPVTVLTHRGVLREPPAGGEARVIRVPHLIHLLSCHPRPRGPGMTR